MIRSPGALRGGTTVAALLLAACAAPRTVDVGPGVDRRIGSSTPNQRAACAMAIRVVDARGDSAHAGQGTGIYTAFPDAAASLGSALQRRGLADAGAGQSGWTATLRKLYLEKPNTSTALVVALELARPDGHTEVVRSQDSRVDWIGGSGDAERGFAALLGDAADQIVQRMNTQCRIGSDPLHSSTNGSR